LLTRTLAFLSGIALFSVALVPVLSADAWDKKTTVTFNEPIQMPHVLLQPGT
jgi:hypothetical protein